MFINFIFLIEIIHSRRSLAGGGCWEIQRKDIVLVTTYNTLCLIRTWEIQRKDEEPPGGCAVEHVRYRKRKVTTWAQVVHSP